MRIHDGTFIASFRGEDGIRARAPIRDGDSGPKAPHAMKPANKWLGGTL